MEDSTKYIYKKEIKKLYKNLSNEELVEKIKAGHRDEVIHNLLPLVIYVANKFNSRTHFEDYVSIGNISLIKGVDTFDIQRGENLASYCHSVIRWGILDYIQDQKDFIRKPRTKNASSKTLNSRPTIVDMEDYENVDYIEEEYSEIKINRKELEGLLLQLPKIKYSDTQIFLDYYLTVGSTLRSVGEKWGFSKQYASMVITKVLNKIKKNKVLMEKLGEILF